VCLLFGGKTNLTYDSEPINQSLKRIVKEAKEGIDRIPIKGTRKGAKYIEIESLIETLFKSFYVYDNLTKEKALKQTSKQLSQFGIYIKATSIDERYLPAIQKKLGIEGDIRKLKDIYNDGDNKDRVQTNRVLIIKIMKLLKEFNNTINQETINNCLTVISFFKNTYRGTNGITKSIPDE
jgi:hypothetical protein